MKGISALAIVALLAVSAPAAAAPVEPAAITVSVNCTSNPEKAKLKNNRSSGLTVYSVTSTFAQRSGEPYTVNNSVGANRSITYKSGSNATGGHVLTRQFIYNNDVRDGVKFRTSAGTFTVHCR